MHRGRTVTLGERLRTLVGPIRHDRDSYSFIQKTLESNLSHVTRSEYHRAASTEVTEDLLRELDGSGAHRRRPSSNTRLFARSGCSEQRSLEKAVEQWPGLTAALFPGVAYLSVNLRLAQNHRVEPGSDREEVCCGVAITAHIDVGRGIFAEAA